jgi:hypothetical protein
MLTSNEELSRKVAQHDKEIAVLFNHVQRLLQPSAPPQKTKIGFRAASARD